MYRFMLTPSSPTPVYAMLSCLTACTCVIDKLANVFPVFPFCAYREKCLFMNSLILPMPHTRSEMSECILFCSILFYSRLCPSTAGSSPPPESSNFLCPLLSLYIPLPVAPQCHLSDDDWFFQLILHPLSATLCF